MHNRATMPHIKQNFQAFLMAVVGRPVYGGVPMLVWEGWGPSRLEEVLHHGYMTAGGSKVNSSTALVVPGGGGRVDR